VEVDCSPGGMAWGEVEVDGMALGRCSSSVHFLRVKEKAALLKLSFLLNFLRNLLRLSHLLMWKGLADGAAVAADGEVEGRKTEVLA
jgi:hypothetical protein